MEETLEIITHKDNLEWQFVCAAINFIYTELVISPDPYGITLDDVVQLVTLFLTVSMVQCVDWNKTNCGAFDEHTYIDENKLSWAQWAKFKADPLRLYYLVSIAFDASLTMYHENNKG